MPRCSRIIAGSVWYPKEQEIEAKITKNTGQNSLLRRSRPSEDVERIGGVGADNVAAEVIIVSLKGAIPHFSGECFYAGTHFIQFYFAGRCMSIFPAGRTSKVFIQYQRSCGPLPSSAVPSGTPSPGPRPQQPRMLPAKTVAPRRPLTCSFVAHHVSPPVCRSTNSIRSFPVVTTKATRDGRLLERVTAA